MTVYWLPTLFFTALMMAIPELAPRGIFFGVRVPEGFRHGALARRLAMRLRLQIAACGSLALLAEIAFGTTHPKIAMLLPMVPFAVGISALAAGRSKVLPFAARSGERVASLSPEEPLPTWVWLAAVPYTALAACAAWLHSNYAHIPERFPIHWDLEGQANGWASRTSLGVYGALLVGCVLMTMMLVTGLAVFCFTRRSHKRRMTLAVLTGSTWFMGYICGMVSLGPLLQLPSWLLIGPALLFVGAILGTAAWVNSRPSDDADDYLPKPASEEYWYGLFYYNSDDPAVFVEKRSGLGYTLNFGNRMSWILAATMGGLLVALLLLVLPR